MLEKAILLDQLNSKISHRPGPLELIEKNILHANEPIERIVKEGLVPFKVTNDDNLTEKNFLSFEDDSQSSESDLFQHTSQIQPELVLSQRDSSGELEKISQDMVSRTQDTHIFESLPTTSAGVINISLVPTNQLLTSCATRIPVATFKIQTDNNEMPALNIPPPPPPPKLVTYHVKPVLQTQVKLNNKTFLPVQITEAPIATINTIPALVPSQSAVNQHVSSFIQNNKNFSAPGKEKNRKKCKSKAVSKARAIKFHEYKGPPNKISSSSSSSSSLSSMAASKKLGETNYELIMQQQCLLEYLEGIYKNPHMQSQVSKPENDFQKEVKNPIKNEKTLDVSLEKSKTFSKPHVTIFPSKPSNQSPPSNITETSKDVIVADVAKLSKMKVSELKAYLKRVNLPVSGPKPLLIERLKPYLPLKPLDDYNDDASVTSNMMSEGNDFYNASLNSVSSSESDMDAQSKDEDIVAEQQRKIEELQRKLQQSQQELEQMKQHKVVDVPSPHQQNILFDSQFQLPNQMSTVYLVDVSSQSPNHAEDLAEVKTPMLLETSPSSTLHQSPPDISIIQNMIGMPDDEKDALSLCNHINKEVDAASLLSSAANTIPMSQDISDVLEILLKNGEWPEMSEDIKCIDSNFIENPDDESTFANASILSSKQFNGDISAEDQFNVMSPMNEDPASPIMHVTEESIDKILGEFFIAQKDIILQLSFSRCRYAHDGKLYWQL